MAFPKKKPAYGAPQIKIDADFGIKNFIKNLIKIPNKFSKEFDPEGKKTLADLMVEPIIEVLKAKGSEDLMLMLYKLEEDSHLRQLEYELSGFKKYNTTFNKNKEIAEANLEFVKTIEAGLADFKGSDSV